MGHCIRTLALILAAGAPAALSGCFLFGGGDDKEKGAMTSRMDSGGANEADATGNAPPSPWRSIELEDDGGSSGSLLPIIALVVSILAMGMAVAQWVLHRRSSGVPH